MHTDRNSAKNENYACDHAKMRVLGSMSDTFYFVQSFRGGFCILMISTVSRRRGPMGDSALQHSDRFLEEGWNAAFGRMQGSQGAQRGRGVSGESPKRWWGIDPQTTFPNGRAQKWRSASNLGYISPTEQFGRAFGLRKGTPVGQCQSDIFRAQQSTPETQSFDKC